MRIQGPTIDWKCEVSVLQIGVLIAGIRQFACRLQEACWDVLV